jgi:hypothetical protein
MTYRHELKYLVHQSDYVILRSRITGLLKKDEHVNSQGIYTVRSLYFDDYYNSAYNEKDMSILIRQKYRIRTYNQSVNVINLERKLKYDSYVYKMSAPLSAATVNQLFHGEYDFLRDSKIQLHNIFYHEIKSKVLRPRIIVDYEREPYTLEAGTVRITFDSNIRASVDSLNIIHPNLAMAETLEDGFLVMEVKYTEFLPEMIQRILPSSNLDCSSISKYVLACDRTFYKRKTNY